MKLKCYIIKRVLSCISLGAEHPGYVTRHLQSCDHCRKEAADYARLGKLLKDTCEPDAHCSLTWNDVRASVTTYPSPAPRVRWSTATAFAACLLIIGLAAIWTVVHFNGSHPGSELRSVKTIPTQKPADKPHIENQPPPKEILVNIPEAPTEQDKAPRAINKPRIKFAQDKEIIEPSKTEAIVKKIETVEPTPETVDNKTNEPNITYMAPEEHVIDVVGVNIDVQDKNNQDSYPIQHVSYCSYASLDM